MFLGESLQASELGGGWERGTPWLEMVTGAQVHGAQNTDIRRKLRTHTGTYSRSLYSSLTRPTHIGTRGWGAVKMRPC